MRAYRRGSRDASCGRGRGSGVRARPLGRTADAIAIFERVVADHERLLGDEHPATPTARANLAVSYPQAGRTADAIAIEARGLELLRARMSIAAWTACTAGPYAVPTVLPMVPTARVHRLAEERVAASDTRCTHR